MTHAHCRGIWVFAEQTEGTLCPTSLELLAKAQELKAVSGTGEPVTAVLLGNAVEALTQTDTADDALLVEELGAVVDAPHILNQNIQLDLLTISQSDLDAVLTAASLAHADQLAVDEDMRAVMKLGEDQLQRLDRAANLGGV